MVDNRMVIYFFQDKKGIIDDYIIYMLENIKKYSEKIVFVSNVKLEKIQSEKIEHLNCTLINDSKIQSKFDGYKVGILNVGFENIKEYNKIILMNDSIIGPINSFQDVFNDMEKRDIDFWGITRYYGTNKNKYGEPLENEIKEYPETDFIVFSKRMICSNEFKKCWEEKINDLIIIKDNYQREYEFIKIFEKRGFKWDTWIRKKEFEILNSDELIFYPKYLVKINKCPIIKKNIFYMDYGNILNESVGSNAKELIEFLEEESIYDTSLIYQNILRTQNQSNIKKCMHNNYILSESNAKFKPKNKKIALIMHIYFEDLINECYEYAKSMPKESDIYITTNEKNKLNKIKMIFSNLECNKKEFILMENRGRDISSLLVACRDKIIENKYDYICFAHDKKAIQFKPYSEGRGFSDKCFKNILGSKYLVDNIIETFEKNKHLGILTPPPPNHGKYYPTLGKEWSYNFEITKKLAQKMKIEVDISENKEPVTPLGTMFWFRVKALDKLFEIEWKYDDFPKEPNGIDGTILHAIERLYGFIAQEKGYYTGWVMSESFAAIEITNINHMLRELNINLFEVYGCNSHMNMLQAIVNDDSNFRYRKLIIQILKMKLKKIIPVKIINLLNKLKKFI